jgi:hydrogenase maturation protein HypF
MAVLLPLLEHTIMPVARLEGRRIRIQGTVQGVGFRPWVYRIARLAGITGRVRNDSGGVTIDAFGDESSLMELLRSLQFPPPAARILAVDSVAIEPEAVSAFEIVVSEPAPERHVSIPPDLATCDDCLAEIFDKADRRHRYPFTNCTNCGPRFTIARDIPYDRATTTMAPFRMCEACRREYEDPANRRFHAQPNACPVCGPRLTFHTHDGSVVHVNDAINAAAAALRAGLVVAVKGLGGFHLACDATSEMAVARLRQRKHRDEKPLAVMVASIDGASRIGAIDEVARRLLTSSERPIVIVDKRMGSSIAPSVAPRNNKIGVFLPYSPLHHLLLADVRRPLVMTSGNLSDEPIAFENDEAVRRLGGIADFFLLHDRAIETRCDDSVVSVVAGSATVTRRSRGYVPRAITITRGFSRPVLACGALLKNTFCIAAGTSAWLGPHIGDLENLETFESYTASIERMERFLQVRPEVIAYDMHPDYLSTLYALHRSEAVKIPVQHHHAHVVGAMAEHGLTGQAIGIAYDGTGFGADGTLWGGEVLVADQRTFQRAATFRPIRLVGGDRAIREPWRIAAALIVDAYDGDPPGDAWSLIAEMAPPQLQSVRTVLRGDAPLPLARGVGRYFDGFGALFLARSQASFEGQVALEWNQAADARVSKVYPFGTSPVDGVWTIDFRPTVRAAVADRLNGEPTAAIAAAFHNTLADATAAAVRSAVNTFGRLPVVASGGCFQNGRLAESVRAALAPEHDVLLHGIVPPGDGGIALGQAVIAEARARNE